MSIISKIYPHGVLLKWKRVRLWWIRNCCPLSGFRSIIFDLCPTDKIKVQTCVFVIDKKNCCLVGQLFSAHDRSTTSAEIIYQMLHIQCGAVITRSIFLKILSKAYNNAPVRARYGVFCRFSLQFMFCPSQQLYTQHLVKLDRVITTFNGIWKSNMLNWHIDTAHDSQIFHRCTDQESK